MEGTEIELVQHCMEDLYLARLEFPRRFYERLFRRAPDIEKLFSQDKNRQSLMLYAVMSMVVSCLNAGKDLSDELAKFGRLHVRAGVQEDMFPVFGQAFLDTMVEFLPHRQAEVLERAWTQTYQRIAEGVIAGMRDEATAAPLFHAEPRTRDRAAVQALHAARQPQEKAPASNADLKGWLV